MLELVDINYIVNEKEILKNINIKINKTDFYVLTGPNGSGKSTLAKIIMGIIKPTSGKIFFDGYDITDMSITERSRLGITFTFQTPVTFKGIKVGDILSLASSKYLTLEKSKEYLKTVGLCSQSYFNRELNNSLSGGELKRIEIASALAKDSKLIIFDEPEAGIDLWSFDELITVFNTIKKKSEVSLIIISHQEKVFKIADKIIIMKEGSIYKEGSFKQINKFIKKRECDFCKEDCKNE